MKNLAWLALVVLVALGCGDDDDDDAGDMDSSSDMDTSEPTPQTCEGYCTVITEACKMGGQDRRQYNDMEACLDHCGGDFWPAGTAGDTSGNTLACRIYHAEAAAGAMNMAPATHCPHAGPTGGDLCGEYCEVFCDTMEVACPGADGYADRNACETDCAGVPTTGSALATSGDNLQCRLYHASAAKLMNLPDVHCPHAKGEGGVGNNPCM